MKEIIIQTKNMIFTRPQTDCAKIMLDLINNPEINTFTQKVHIDLTLEDEIKWVNSHQDDYVFSMFSKADEYIGNCGFNEISDKVGTIGIFIAPEFQNRGLGTEALLALIDYGFNTLQLEEINLDVFSHNKRAIHCYKKLGFKEYKRMMPRVRIGYGIIRL